MRSLILAIALALPAAAASAAPITTDPHPSTSSSHSRHAQWIRVSFYNPSAQGRMLTIGEESFSVPGGRTVDLQIAVGSNVQLSSPWDSHVSGQVQVTAANANHIVTLQ